MKYKLVALDIDGTILDNRGQLAPRTHQVILQVQKRGIRVVLATGRRLAATLPLAEKLGITTPLIVHNGAVVIERTSNKILFQMGLELAFAAAIHGELEKRGLNYVVYTGESAGEEVVAPIGTWQGPEDLLGRYLGETATFLPKVSLVTPPIRFSLVDRPYKVDPFYQFLQQHYGNEINIMLFGAERANWRGIEIMNGGCSKGTGVAQVAAGLGIEAAEIVAIGDNVNDLEMISLAGLGVAMENGSSLLKAKADVVAPSNEAHGVAEILEQLFLL